MQEFNEKLNHFGEWIIRLVVLNFLWVGFSILGLGIFGDFPSNKRHVFCVAKMAGGQ